MGAQPQTEIWPAQARDVAMKTNESRKISVFAEKKFLAPPFRNGLKYRKGDEEHWSLHRDLL